MPRRVPSFEFELPEPDPDTGVIAVGGDLEPGRVLGAYRRGIFPWPADDMPLLWFSPAERAVLDFADLHVPHSLVRARRRSPLRLTIDASFRSVIRACASTPRHGQDGTWITPEVERAYVGLHDSGIAHSAEAWRGDQLVGGLYGVDVDGAFAAESMFHTEPNASKLVLLHLVAHLASRGLDWMDIQVLTPHMARFGARTMPRAVFLTRLAATRRRGLRLF